MSKQEILTLLRSGALEQAEKEYLRLGLDTDTSSEDIMALGGRILKAKALEQDGAAGKQFALKAARAYGIAYDRFGGTYSGINTAAMYLVAGDKNTAHSTAQQVKTALRSITPTPGVDAYYHMATVAEAWLILGDLERAEQTLGDAVPLDPHNFDAHASTLKQFDMLLMATGQDSTWLAQFRPPKSLHFAGHLFDANAAGPDGKAGTTHVGATVLEQTIKAWLADNAVGAAYGALAAGSDIVIAEQVLALGIELHVVQPCPHELFAEKSLRPFGRDWQTRFEACLDKADSVRFVSQDTTLCDDLTLAFASETAMGLATLRAQRLATSAEQLVIWDGVPEAGTSNTARDALLWSASGRCQHIIPFPFQRNPRPTKKPSAKPDRHLKAMLFADVQGYSRLSERQVPVFVEHVLGALAGVRASSTYPPRYCNTWGDGLFLVFDSVAAAAAGAVCLQATFRSIDLERLGLPQDLALRVGGHYGPAHLLTDPVMGQDGYFGREVTVAARIEPVTAPDSIFVSETFACALAAEGRGGFRCEALATPVDAGLGEPLNLFSLRGPGQ